MGNGLLSLVAHIGKAKSFPFEFAVAGIDDEMMFFAQIFRQLQDIDAAIVFYAGERFGAEILFGEEIEAARAHPVVHKRVGAGVALVTIR